MPASVTKADLPAFLGRIATECEKAVSAHLETTRPDLRFQRQALFAVAALEGCSAQDALERPDIRLVRDAASDAAAVCRTQHPEDALVTVTTLLDEVVDVCDRLLDEPVGDGVAWQRFLFADVDVSVVRRDGLWRVRVGADTTEEKLLDVALDELLQMSSHRIAELTVQILDWYAHSDRR